MKGITMSQSHVYRGFKIRIDHDGVRYFPHWCESIYDKWESGKVEYSAQAALSESRKAIDRQYLIESDQLDAAEKS
jgi:hypothetical protein